MNLGGRIFESYDISLENTSTSHAVSLALVMYACSDSAMRKHPLQQERGVAFFTIT